MSKRAALMLVTIAGQFAWIKGIGCSGLAPLDAPVVRGVLLYVPMMIIACIALSVALRRGLFTRAELGLEAPPRTMRRGRIGRVLLLVAIFIAAALVDVSGPLGTMTMNGMSYEEIVDHLRRHEYRYIYGRHVEPPLSPWDVCLNVVRTVVFPPLTEEIPYRALLIPVALSLLSRSRAALVSGVVFFLYHWAVGWAPHPAFFISGWAYAWAFMLAGLSGSIAAHAGGNFGVFMLGTFAAYAST